MCGNDDDEHTDVLPFGYLHDHNILECTIVYYNILYIVYYSIL